MGSVTEKRRRVHVRGHENVLKRLLVHAGAFNLGLLMRTLFGVGTPRSLQGRAVALATVLSALWTLVHDAVTAHRWSSRPLADSVRPIVGFLWRDRSPENAACTTGFHEKAGRCQAGW